MLMLTNAARAILDVESLRDEIAILLGPPDGGLLGSEGPQASVAAPEEDQKRVEKIRRDLLRVLKDLDARLLKALERNRLSVIARYILLGSLEALFVAAVAYAFVDQNVALGVVGLLSVTPIPWILRNLRSLQDERIWLFMRLKKYEPRIIVCIKIDCLQSLALEISSDLEQLSTPVIADANT